MDVVGPSHSDGTPYVRSQLTSRFSCPAAVEDRRRLFGESFESRLAAVAAKGLSSVGFHACARELLRAASTNPRAKPPMQDPWGWRTAGCTEDTCRHEGTLLEELRQLELLSRSARLFLSETGINWKCCSARLMRWSERIGEMRIG
jgi:hypothetical protein